MYPVTEPSSSATLQGRKPSGDASLVAFLFRVRWPPRAATSAPGFRRGQDAAVGRWPRASTSGWWALACWLDGRRKGSAETHKIHHEREGALAEALDATVETAEQAAKVVWRTGRERLRLQVGLRWYPPNPSGESHARFAPRDRLLVRFNELEVANAAAALEAVANAAENIYGDRQLPNRNAGAPPAVAGDWRVECSLTPGRSGERDVATTLQRVGEGDLAGALDALVDVAEDATAATWPERNDIQALVELRFLPARTVLGRRRVLDRMHVNVVTEDLKSAITALEAVAAMAESVYAQAETRR
jgi:hypothetical protein